MSLLYQLAFKEGTTSLNNWRYLKFGKNYYFKFTMNVVVLLLIIPEALRLLEVTGKLLID